MTREQQLEHRIAMIQDDLNKLIEFIDEERMMERFDKASKYTESAWTHIINMEIACDLSSDESLSWKLYGTSRLTDDELSERKRLYNNVHNTNY